ncbi:MAG TPA: hypothetical protein VK427_03770 [Kofleriaceae bacterium]|nr:hypothetical protein [Kofleriaceae bacterium]
MRAIALSLLLGACGDNTTKVPSPADAAQPTALAPCLDHPDRLAQPSTQLPCELLPPGFVAR